MTALNHWLEWQRLCALALCAPETQAALQAFAYARFRRFAGAYAHRTNAAARSLTPEPQAAWHLFETGLRIRNTRAGKSYKQWLLARADRPPANALEGVESGATLLLRDVVREHLRREYSAPNMVSGQTPRFAHDDTSPDLQTLLPAPFDTAEEVACRELEQLAAQETETAFDALSRRERVALLARDLGWSLAHPAVVAAAGCRKSVLNAAYQSALVSLAERLRLKYRREDPSMICRLAIGVFDRVRQRLLWWGKSENACAAFFIPEEP